MITSLDGVISDQKIEKFFHQFFFFKKKNIIVDKYRSDTRRIVVRAADHIRYEECGPC